MSTTEERLKKIVTDHLGVDEKDVTPSASFTNDLGADSLDEIEMRMNIEEEFDIEIPDETAEKLDTFQKLLDYVTNAVNGA